MQNIEKENIDREVIDRMEEKIKELMEGDVGIQLNGRLPGSLATKADLHYKDLLVEVNGVPVKNMNDYIAGKNKKKGSMSMTFLRPCTHKLFEVHMNFETNEVRQNPYG